MDPATVSETYSFTAPPAYEYETDLWYFTFYIKVSKGTTNQENSVCESQLVDDTPICEDPQVSVTIYRGILGVGQGTVEIWWEWEKDDENDGDIDASNTYTPNPSSKTITLI